MKYYGFGMRCFEIDTTSFQLLYCLYLLTPWPPPPQAMPLTSIDLQPDLAAATISCGVGFVIKLWTGISWTAASFSNSFLYKLNSAIFFTGTSGACTAYCFQLLSPKHGESWIVTFSKNLQFLAPAWPVKRHKLKKNHQCTLALLKICRQMLLLRLPRPPAPCAAHWERSTNNMSIMSIWNIFLISKIFILFLRSKKFSKKSSWIFSYYRIWDKLQFFTGMSLSQSVQMEQMGFIYGKK